MIEPALASLWYDTAGSPLPHQLPLLADLVGPTRIVYGSDYCFTPAAEVVAQVRALTTAQRVDWATLTSRNAGRLLGG